MASSRIVGVSVFLVMLALHHASAQVQSTIHPTLPSLGDQDQTKQAGSEDAIYCRPPQSLTDSRLTGPRVCKPIREWNRLHASGLDVDAHGDVKPVQNLGDLKNLSH